MLWTPVRVQLKQQLANSSESCNDTLFATLVWANLCFRLATSDTIILSKVTKVSCASLLHWGRVWETAWFSHNVDVKRRSRPDYTSYMHKQAQLKRKKKRLNSLIRKMDTGGENNKWQESTFCFKFFRRIQRAIFKGTIQTIRAFKFGFDSCLPACRKFHFSIFKVTTSIRQHYSTPVAVSNASK